MREIGQQMWLVGSRDSFEEMSLHNLRMFLKSILKKLKSEKDTKTVWKAIEIVAFQNISSSIVSISHSNFPIRKSFEKN